jgi:catechol 2,3-dioxygenase-like lactoylglutathione lyase family enzyme
MLGQYRIHAAIPVQNPERAREFYGGTLEIPSVRDDDYGTNFSCKDSIFRIYATDSKDESDSTRAAFTVDDDFEKVFRELQDRGVPFLEYDTPYIKTVDGIAELGGVKVAWFTDPDDNTLALLEGPLPGVDD